MESNQPSGTERLKVPYRKVMLAIRFNDIQKAVDIIRETMAEHKDFAMMRMMLDATQTIRDEEIVKPVRAELLDICQKMIGKLN